MLTFFLSRHRTYCPWNHSSSTVPCSNPVMQSTNQLPRLDSIYSDHRYSSCIHVYMLDLQVYVGQWEDKGTFPPLQFLTLEYNNFTRTSCPLMIKYTSVGSNSRAKNLQLTAPHGTPELLQWLHQSRASSFVPSSKTSYAFGSYPLILVSKAPK